MNNESPDVELATINDLSPQILPINISESQQLEQSAVMELQRITERILLRLQRDATDAIAIGQDLIRAQEICPPGLFTQWLSENFSMSKSTAHRYMNLAQQYGSGVEAVVHIPLTVLYELSAPKNDDVRDIITQQIIDGTIEPSIKGLKEALAKANAAMQEQKTHALDLEKKIDYLQRVGDMNEKWNKQQLEQAQSETSQIRTHAKHQIKDLTNTINDLKQQLAELEKHPTVITQEVEVLPSDIREQMDERHRQVIGLQEQLITLEEERDRLQGEFNAQTVQMHALQQNLSDDVHAANIRDHWKETVAAWRNALMLFAIAMPTPEKAAYFEEEEWDLLSSCLESCEKVARKLRHLQQTTPSSSVKHGNFTMFE